MFDNFDIIILEKTESFLKIKINDYEKPIFRSVYEINYNKSEENIDIDFNDLEDEYIQEIINCYLKDFYFEEFNKKKIECKIFLKELETSNYYKNIINYLDYGKGKTLEEIKFKIGRFNVNITFIFEFLYKNSIIHNLSVTLLDADILTKKYYNILHYYLNNIYPKEL